MVKSICITYLLAVLNISRVVADKCIYDVHSSSCAVSSDNTDCFFKMDDQGNVFQIPSDQVTQEFIDKSMVPPSENENKEVGNTKAFHVKGGTTMCIFNEHDSKTKLCANKWYAQPGITEDAQRCGGSLSNCGNSTPDCGGIIVTDESDGSDARMLNMSKMVVVFAILYSFMM